jgi:hypothetical protein
VVAESKEPMVKSTATIHNGGAKEKSRIVEP